MFRTHDPSPKMDRRESLFREEEEDEGEDNIGEVCKKEGWKDFHTSSNTEPALLRIRNYSDNVQGIVFVIMESLHCTNIAIISLLHYLQTFRRKKPSSVIQSQQKSLFRQRESK